MREYIKDACETIDAAMFSGDAFDDNEEGVALFEYMLRWSRCLSQKCGNTIIRIASTLTEGESKGAMQHHGSDTNEPAPPPPPAPKLMAPLFTIEQIVNVLNDSDHLDDARSHFEELKETK